MPEKDMGAVASAECRFYEQSRLSFKNALRFIKIADSFMVFSAF
jgi:hypothetical protein